MMDHDGNVMRGEIVGAEFDYDDPTGQGRIVVRVAVDGDTRVGAWQVAVVDRAAFDASLPTADDVRGLLA